MMHTFTQVQWDGLTQQWPIGTRAHGTIVHVARFGVFLELDELPAIDALLEIIQMPQLEREPSEHLIYPDDYPVVGTRVEAFIFYWPEKPGQIRLTQKYHN